MSWYAKQLLPLERPRLDEDFGLEPFDHVEQRHRRHLALGEEDEGCYCYADRHAKIESLREETEGWDDDSAE